MNPEQHLREIAAARKRLNDATIHEEELKSEWKQSALYIAIREAREARKEAAAELDNLTAAVMHEYWQPELPMAEGANVIRMEGEFAAEHLRTAREALEQGLG